MVFENVKKILSGQLGIDEKKITLESRLIEDLGADSLDLVDLLMTLENEYNITIPDAKAQSMKTIKDVVDFFDAIKK
jgi:acyl carrier protein